MNPTKWLMDYMDQHPIVPEMTKAINVVGKWLHLKYYKSKQQRLAEWNPVESDIYAIMCNILIGCFINREMTYQAMIGWIQNSIKLNDQIDRLKTAAELIAIAFQADLIVITKRDDTMFISTEFELDEDIPEFDKHQPDRIIHKAEVNQILGCRFKQHDYDTCISHINTMNSVPLTLEWRVIDTMEDTPKKDEIEGTEQWQDYVRRSHETYENYRDQTFYMRHNYDTRGRVYCEGYYINYQGSSYKKAIICLANKEIIELT